MLSHQIALRRSIKEPISEILATYETMSAAVDAHFSGDTVRAANLFRAANSSAVWAWTNPAWEQPYLNIRCKFPVSDTSVVAAAHRDPERHPSDEVKRDALERDGFRCRYCGIPVIGADVRKLAHRLYPDAVPWGRYPSEQHAAFQAMWLQFDHVVPHSHGGRSSLDNIVVACGLCNYGKDRYTLAQLGLSDPRAFDPVPSPWDGLQRLLVAVSHAKKSRPVPKPCSGNCAGHQSPKSTPAVSEIVQLDVRLGLVDSFVPGAWISKGYLYTPQIGGKQRWFRLSDLAIAEQEVREGVAGCRIRCAARILARRGLDASHWISSDS